MIRLIYDPRDVSYIVWETNELDTSGKYFYGEWQKTICLDPDTREKDTSPGDLDWIDSYTVLLECDSFEEFSDIIKTNPELFI